MEAGTVVILNLSPPPPPLLPAIFRRKFSISLKTPSLFSGASLSTRTSNLRIRNVSQPPNQGEFYGSSNNVNLTPTAALSFAKGLLKFAISNLLPLSLVGGVALGFNSPTLGRLAYKYSLSKFITFWLFFLSGVYPACVSYTLKAYSQSSHGTTGIYYRNCNL